MFKMMQTRLRPRALPVALLVTTAALAGCQEDLGSSPAAFDDAAVVAEERLSSVVDSVHKAIGAPEANEPSPSRDGKTSVDDSPVSVVDGHPVAATEPGRAADKALEEPETPVLAWSAPLTREDGSSLADGEIRGYQLYYRLRHQENYRTLFIKHNEGTRLTLDEFDPGAYEFSITTVDTDGLESRRSEPVTVNII